MCIIKEQGGMGFIDINIFNQAILGKQSWGISKQLESLLARILKEKYYKSIGNFMRAEIGKNSSYVWKSIMCGKEFFDKGNSWRIRNGSSVTIACDSWLPGERNSRRFQVEAL